MMIIYYIALSVLHKQQVRLKRIDYPIDTVGYGMNIKTLSY